MPLKSRSRTHHPNMHYSYTGGRHYNMPFHLDPPKNVLLLHWEKTRKIFLIGYQPNKCSKFLLLSLKSFVAKKTHGTMQKLFIKKGETKKKKLRKKWTSVRDSPCSLAKIFTSFKERYVFKEHSRIRSATIYIHHISLHMHILI